MSQLRNRPRSARLAFFGLGLCSFALTPTELGYQDIASLLARQPHGKGRVKENDEESLAGWLNRVQF